MGSTITTRKPSANRPLSAIMSRNLRAVEAAENGLPTSSLGSIRMAGITSGELHALIIPARTLKHRVSRKQRLSMEETDRVLRLQRMIGLADQIFTNHEKAMHWLRDGNDRLDGRAPLELLRTEVGGDLVEQMLVQIAEGIFV